MTWYYVWNGLSFGPFDQEEKQQIVMTTRRQIEWVYEGEAEYCEICGERFHKKGEQVNFDDGEYWHEDDERAEFVNKSTGVHVIAHADCGLNNEWELA